MTQYAIGDDIYPEPRDDWKCYLRRDAGEWWVRSFEEAKRRQEYHEDHGTPQTSNRDLYDRDLLEEWKHLKGEVALAILLAARGYSIFLDEGWLNWGESSLKARERSRRGNVIPGVSVYVPHKEGEGLIVRGDERREYPDLRYVLVWERRAGRVDEYMQARGHLRAEEAHKRGLNFGPQGTRLRDPEDRLVAPHRLDAMSTLTEVV